MRLIFQWKFINYIVRSSSPVSPSFSCSRSSSKPPVVQLRRSGIEAERCGLALILFWSLCSLYLFLFSDFPPLYLFQFLDFCFVVYLFIFVGSLGIWLLGNITFQCLVLWFLVLLVFVWMSAVVLLCIYFFFILWSKPCFNFQCCFMIGMQTWDDNHGIGCSRSISMYLIEHKFGHLDVYQYMGTMKIIS